MQASKCFFAFICLLFFYHLNAQQQSEVLIRIDDIGMNHSVNEALMELAETGMPLSASVMFTCPWYQEAVEILKSNPQIAVGIHLTLNSEWKNFRWGPVIGQSAVPTLVDKVGYFFPSTAGFLQSDYTLEDVEVELESQIRRALASGVNLEYMDYHMRTALATPELISVVEKLARKYGLKQSMRMGENVVSLFDVPVREKHAFMMKYLLSELTMGKPNVIVIHIAKDNPEMRALVDMNNPDQNTSSVASHRHAELNVLLSEDFVNTLEERKIQLITYKDVELTK